MKLSSLPLRRIERRGAGTLVCATAGPVLVTLVGLSWADPALATMALLYVPAVLAAAWLAGTFAGMGASILSFLGLNYFFTEPVRTLKVDSAPDGVALAVFVVVSLAVGLLVSASVAERQRAEIREAEVAVLNRFTSALLAGERVGSAVERFAADMNGLLGTSRTRVTTAVSDPVDVGISDDGRAHEVVLRARGRSVGSLRVWPPRGHRSLSPEQVRTVDSFGKQLALALEQLRLTDEIRQAEGTAEANRLKATLFAGVTHDVKTPLAAIIASVTSLLDGSGFTQEQLREHLEMIGQEAERLHRVVNNLLDLSRLRAGVLHPAKQDQPIDDLVESTVARLRPLVSGRRVEVRLEGAPPAIPMDIVQIDQVLTNLIENAVRYSPEGTPIGISAVGDNDRVRVSVADQGPGVAREDQARIFEPFEVGNPVEGGTGLGLAVSKAIVEAHGGRIWVARGPQGGAVFTFELPVSVRPTAAAEVPL